MAKVIESKKGFKLIEATSVEIAQFGGLGICDNCNEAARKGVYIAVLNQWFCQRCFENWHNRAIHYPEDESVENDNFEFYKKLLKVDE